MADAISPEKTEHMIKTLDEFVKCKQCKEYCKDPVKIGCPHLYCKKCVKALFLKGRRGKKT